MLFRPETRTKKHVLRFPICVSVRNMKKLFVGKISVKWIMFAISLNKRHRKFIPGCFLQKQARKMQHIFALFYLEIYYLFATVFLRIIFIIYLSIVSANKIYHVYDRNTHQKQKTNFCKKQTMRKHIKIFSEKQRLIH